MDVYPLMINYNGFYVGGALWSSHCERFLGSSMTRFLRSRFRRFLRKEEALKRFYSGFDSTILEEQKSCREEVKREHRGVILSWAKRSKGGASRRDGA